MVKARRSPVNGCPLRLYFLNGIGAVTGTGDRPGVFDELTILGDGFSISTFADVEDPYSYLLGRTQLGTPIEIDQLPGFTDVLSAESWHRGFDRNPVNRQLFRPLDWIPTLLYRGLGCTHKKSSAERQRLQQGGVGEAAAEFSPANLPNAAQFPYEYVRYAKRPETFDKCFGFERSAMVGPGGDVGLLPTKNTLMVVEAEIAYFVAHRADRRKPPRMLGYSASNDGTGHSVEAENTLYLPQAKVFTGCLSIGPCMVVPQKPLELTTENCTPEAKARFIPDSTSISLKLIAADGSIKVAGTATAGDTFRPIQYYMPWAIAHRDYPMFWVQGGTGIMHPKGVGVAEGDTIIISMDQVGDLITGAKLLPRTFLDEWLESPRAA